MGDTSKNDIFLYKWVNCFPFPRPNGVVVMIGVPKYGKVYAMIKDLGTWPKSEVYIQTF